jgi:hypothetical protein
MVYGIAPMELYAVEGCIGVLRRRTQDRSLIRGFVMDIVARSGKELGRVSKACRFHKAIVVGSLALTDSTGIV